MVAELALPGLSPCSTAIAHTRRSQRELPSMPLLFHGPGFVAPGTVVVDSVGGPGNVGGTTRVNPIGAAMVAAPWKAISSSSAARHNCASRAGSVSSNGLR